MSMPELDSPTMRGRKFRRPLFLAAVGLVLAGAASLAFERAGVYECGCYPECWCKRPGLNLFRWLVPRFHNGPWNPAAKARHEQGLAS
jgi:hypothetical protein